LERQALKKEVFHHESFFIVKVLASKKGLKIASSPVDVPG
jgi:hypothetical protein